MTLVVGLTGGIGSGKSSVANAFAARGAPVVDVDAIAHEISIAGGEGQRAVAHAFGTAAIADDGALDRAWLRRQAFADPGFRTRLEGVLHPLIRAEADRRVARWQEPYGIVMVPLLLERAGAKERVDRVLVVDCPEEMQIARVMARSGLSEVEVRAIMAAQLSRDERLRQADDVIDNSGACDAIAPQVALLDARYREMAAHARTRAE
ncbi:MAG TPA: dephospho-CoA kinase [Casimicrobiaceae bacterium]|nr:dephospho-CoA kinase [Casimicrobiaceae bacterium]